LGFDYNVNNQPCHCDDDPTNTSEVDAKAGEASTTLPQQNKNLCCHCQNMAQIANIAGVEWCVAESSGVSLR